MLRRAGTAAAEAYLLAGLAPKAQHGHGRPTMHALGERCARTDARWGATLLTGERFSPFEVSYPRGIR